MNKICDRLKLLRKTLFLRQSDIANVLMIKQSSYSMIEKGIRELTERNIILLCNEYSVNPQWLKMGEEPMFLGKTKETNTIFDSVQKMTNYSREWLETGTGEFFAEPKTSYLPYNKVDVTDRFLIVLELLKEKGISYTEVANKLGVSTSLVSEIRRGSSKINPTHAQKLIEIFGINPNWLLYGKGDINDIFNTPIKSNAHIVNPENSDWLDVPFVPLHARATFAETFLDTNVKEVETIKIPKRPGINYKNAKVFEVDGDSMEPTLISGEQVLCEVTDAGNWRFITGVVVVAFGNMVVIKRIKDNNLFNGELTLWSDNEQGGKITLSKDTDEIRRIYKVKYTVYKPIR